MATIPEGATVAQRIQAVMRERGWVNPQGEPNVKEMERRTGLSYGALNNLIRGRTERPEMRTVEKVARGLRVPVDALLGRGDFDLRAYEMGKQVVADAVRESLAGVADLPPPKATPEETLEGEGLVRGQSEPDEEPGDSDDEDEGRRNQGPS